MKRTHRYLEIVIILLLTIVHHLTGIWWLELAVFLFLSIFVFNLIGNVVDYFISKDRKK
jgi:hypothetical protein